MADHIVISTADSILQIRLNRPEKKNALSVAMYAAMADALENADGNASVRAIIIAGTDGCFTSGNDVMDFLQNPPAGSDSPVIRFLQALSTASKPVIAAVTGVAVGIGVTMLLHCDLVYAADIATFQLPFVNLGLVPEGASSMLLPRLMGHQRASELLLLGEKFDARSAHEIGLVNALVPANELAGLVQQRAAALAAKPPASLRMTKALLKREPESIPARMTEEGRYFSRQLVSPEAREAMEAFMQRRKPDFSRFA
ncbi:MAG TPA: crotonase/enoyl-CoA hydratase family protein [Candidatus Angelobacter sp.]